MLKFINSFSTDLIEIRCLHNDEKKLPGKFVVLDKMDALAQAGHMTNEYSKYKAIHMFYAHPSKNNCACCCVLLLCAPAVCSLLLQQGNTNIQTSCLEITNVEKYAGNPSRASLNESCCKLHRVQTLNLCTDSLTRKPLCYDYHCIRMYLHCAKATLPKIIYTCAVEVRVHLASIVFSSSFHT